MQDWELLQPLLADFGLKAYLNLYV